MNVFMDPMRKKKIVSEDLIMAIFGNVRVLLNINKQLLEALYVAVKHDSGCPDYANANLGAVILRFCPFFKMYVISSAAASTVSKKGKESSWIGRRLAYKLLLVLVFDSFVAIRQEDNIGISWKVHYDTHDLDASSL